MYVYHFVLSHLLFACNYLMVFRLNVGFIVVTRMPPKRGQNYTESSDSLIIEFYHIYLSFVKCLGQFVVYRCCRNKVLFLLFLLLSLLLFVYYCIWDNLVPPPSSREPLVCQFLHHIYFVYHCTPFVVSFLFADVFWLFWGLFCPVCSRIGCSWLWQYIVHVHCVASLTLLTDIFFCILLHLRIT